jgi:hypothetical protein
MVAGHVPREEDKRKLKMESHRHIWDVRTSLEFAQMDSLKDVYQLKKEFRSLKDATHHHMEDIMGHFVLMQRSGKVDFSSQQCMITRRILSKGVERVRGMGTSTKEMPCHSPTTSR